ncbi:MAG: mechanosensitive ion channel family protein [Dehalococcoidales bacterium]|nr:MAG: mechanosensitive ion channel family protein [Dehalococcoidales bacterium]
MPPDFVSGSPLLETLWATGIVLVFTLGSWLIFLGMRLFHNRLRNKDRETLASQLVGSLYRPVVFLVMLQGIFLALNSVTYLETWRPVLLTVNIAVVIVLVTYGFARVSSVLLVWYLRSRSVRRKANIDEGLIRFFRRFLIIIVYIFGVLILLDYLNIAITPIVAGLGIGGLAVALALQPTLGNFFAGVQIVSDRMLRVGDYIEIDPATRGYVTDIGWRSTRIRTPFNNMLIIPNSRLVDSIITNYYGPSMEVAVIVNCGVSYSSDLTYVEKVTLEVAREVIDELEEAVKTFEPWFGFDGFGDSNINFWIWVQARDRISTFRMQSELVKRLHARFGREGITINYPVRTTYLHWPEGTPPSFPFANPDTVDTEGN